MNGTCQCGGIIKDRQHVVYTEAKAKEYGETNPPLTIVTSECNSCHRVMVEAFDSNSNKVNK